MRSPQVSTVASPHEGRAKPASGTQGNGSGGLVRIGIDDSRWEAFVATNPAATLFHHPTWSRLIHECYGFPAFALAHIDQRDRVDAGLPVVQVGRGTRRRWVSLPFTDHCPPLLEASDPSDPDLPDQGERFLRALEDAQRESGMAALEVRGEVSPSSEGRREVAVTHRLPLRADPDAVYRGFKRLSVRKGIKRAIQNGIVVREAADPVDLTRTYYRLHLQTRRRLGVPAQPRRYFEHLWHHVLAPGSGFLLLAYRGTTPIAGAVFLAWNGTVTYKYGASDERFWDLHPNHLLMWSAIRFGCERGFHTFDFGRSDLHSKGLRQFKSGWAEEQPLVYTTIGRPIAPPSTGRARAAAEELIRRSPAWICRAAGELLYKYAA